MRAILANPVVVSALLVLAAAATVWILGPVVAFALGRRRLWVDVDADPARAAPLAGDADYQRRYHEVVALGFRPIGTTRSHAKFLTPMQWRYDEPEPTRWFASADGRTFFFLDRALRGEPVRLGAATFFEGGGMAYTRSPGIGVPRTELGSYVRVETHGRDPKELLSLHAEEAEAFRRARGLEVRGATLEIAAAEMLASDKLLVGSQKAGALFAMPLALFGIPALAALRPLRHGPKGLGLGALFICFAALTYLVMGWGLLKVIQRQRLRDSHRVDLNQKEAAPDGTIVDTGKYEAWVRRLAAFGVLHVGAIGVYLLTRVPVAFQQGGVGVFMLAVYLFIAFHGVKGLAARARGRAEKKGQEWNRNDGLLTWWMSAMLFSSTAALFRGYGLRAMIALQLAQLVPPALAYLLDKAGRRKSAD